MNKLFVILFLLTTFKPYSQKIEKEVGDFKITKEGFYIEENDKEMRNQKAEFYFVASGNIIEKLTYGKPHYGKLDVIGEIEQFFYSENKLESSKKYSSECFACGYLLYHSKYNYDANGKLSKEETFRENGSILTTTTYIYKPNYSETHFDSTLYYQKKYNEQNQLIECNQVYKEKLRWQYLFEYSNNCKIGKFQTYYGNGKEKSNTETECYDSQKRIISKELVDYYRTKLNYVYSENGILKEIREYESSLENENYKLKRLTKIKINRCPKKVISEAVVEINSQLISE